MRKKVIEMSSQMVDDLTHNVATLKGAGVSHHGFSQFVVNYK